MKKNLPKRVLVLGLVILFVAISQAVQTFQSPKIFLEPNKTIVSPGEVFEVNISVQNFNNRTILVNFTYDPSKITLSSTSSFRFFDTIDFIKVGENYVAYLGASRAYVKVPEKTNLAKVVFEVNSNASGTIKFEIVNAIVDGVGARSEVGTLLVTYPTAQTSVPEGVSKYVITVPTSDGDQVLTGQVSDSEDQAYLKPKNVTYDTSSDISEDISEDQIYISPYYSVQAMEEIEIIVDYGNIVSVVVTSNESVYICVRVEKLKNLPMDVSKQLSQFFVIDMWSIDLKLSRDADVKGKIIFKIEREKIEKNSEIFDVFLLRWDGKQWIELPTILVRSDKVYNYYEAETSTFSYFVAVLKKEKPLQTEKSKTDHANLTEVESTPLEKTFVIPGFELILAILGFLLTLLFFNKYRSK
ncbi:MAG: PGF-pre-PGF domain-containing protein [Leptospiraceae bacterium]|nr:PGF-pre-PGF domain-containing protein [Leptospiraceae bacterium]